MERYNQRRCDCRRCASMPGSCGSPAPYASSGSGNCSMPRSGSPSCGCNSPRIDANVCQPGSCPSSINSGVAMGYVPWQKWECTYPLEKALFIGTVFPSLDKPFEIGRCAVRP